MTLEQLRRVMPFAKAKDLLEFVEPLNKTMERFSIDTPKRQAAFSGQLAHESGSLRYRAEIASGEAYEGRKDLGNTQPGDGKRYKGRGPIQITGRANYKAFSDFSGHDFISHPEDLERPEWGALAAGWFWDKHGLNALADVGNFKAITKRINGGLNGYTDRCEHWERAKKVLGA